VTYDENYHCFIIESSKSKTEDKIHQNFLYVRTDGTFLDYNLKVLGKTLDEVTSRPDFVETFGSPLQLNSSGEINYIKF
jgi:hypothetical protein